jgi:A/G-specific adenine glycosylase
MPRPITNKHSDPSPIALLPAPSLTLQVASCLVIWQKQAGRHDLPWQVRDPYRVWLSEIMLQQTQVSTALPYYQNFLQRFPTLESLAEANQESVLEAWSGLGYYSRARNLHRCAKQLVDQYGSTFPDQLEALVSLPGIGRSTAAAIAVFCFGRREAILDGNVKRVLSRVFAIAGVVTQSSTEKELWRIASEQVPAQDIEAYTQGLMDLGASLCGPKRTHCSACPLRSLCIAHRSDLVPFLPTPKPRKTLDRREETFALMVHGKQVILERQKSPGIWGGLLSLPKENDTARIARHLKQTAIKVGELPGFEHSFSHFRLRASINLYRLIDPSAAPSARHFAASPSAGYGIEGQAPATDLEAFRADAALQDIKSLGPADFPSAALPKPIKTYLLKHALTTLPAFAENA